MMQAIMKETPESRFSNTDGPRALQCASVPKIVTAVALTNTKRLVVNFPEG